jgi:agmatine deiminase
MLNKNVDLFKGLTPKSLGYYFPAEFAPHDAIWLTWPHKEESWPGKINSIYPSYTEFVKIVSLTERVCINVLDEKMHHSVNEMLALAGVNLNQVQFFIHPSNDAWCRDHGPSFLIRNNAEHPKAIIDWNINAWGGKYPPFDLDDVIPTSIANALNLPVFYPNIIMEGGSVDFNGAGTIMTSKSCLLNPNRNPHLNQNQIEKYLGDYYGIDQILWVSDGIVGDDTDGHIDDTVRFINEDTVLTVVENNVNSKNYELLNQNLKELKQMRLLNGKQLNIIELPMPKEVIYEQQLLPASYANFYISNGHIIVPTFKCDQDDKAMQIIQSCFQTRQVVGIDSTDIIWGLGSFHCLSQQEPSIL